MDTHRRFLVILFLVVALAALVLLASGLSRLDLNEGKPFSLGGGGNPLSPPGLPITLPTSEALSGALLSFFLMAYLPFAVVVYVIACIVSKEARKRVLNSLLRVGIILLCVYLLTRQHVFDRFLRTNQPVDAGNGQVPVSIPPPLAVNPPPWLTLLVSFAVLVVLGLLSWWLLRLVRLRPGRRSAMLDKVAEEAREALADIEAGAALKDTVLRCYAEMSRAVDRQRGIRRDQAVTPREFESCLEKAGLPMEPVQRLTRLFELVRYGTKPLGIQEEQEAIASLNAIIEAIGSTP